jgi:hypothetical protein
MSTTGIWHLDEVHDDILGVSVQLSASPQPVTSRLFQIRII